MWSNLLDWNSLFSHASPWAVVKLSSILHGVFLTLVVESFSLLKGLAIRVEAFSVSEIVGPLTFVLVLVCVNHGSGTVSLSSLEFTGIFRVIWPYHSTVSGHVILLELSLIDLSSLSEVVLTISVELSLEEFALVEVTFEFESSLSSFLAFDEVTCIDNFVVVPLLSTLSVVHIVQPLSIVHGTLLVNKNTVAVSLSVFPLTLVDVTIGVDHSTFTLELTLLGHSLIL